MSFYANYEYHPQLHSLKMWKNDNLTTDDLVTQLLQLWTTMKFSLLEVQNRIKNLLTNSKKN